MSAAMDRIRREAMTEYGDAPATAEEALAHVLKVYADDPDEKPVLTATTGIYPEAPWTGLRLGDLRALAAHLGL